MRKFLLLLTLVFMSICKVNAQASGYTFSSSSGTYTAITGGTVIKDGSSTMDSYASGAITIPSFTFNGTSYTTAYATSNGFITLGGSAPSAYTSTGISSNTGSGIAICPMSADLDRANTNATTEMRWETVGDEVVFQWKQMKRYGQTENFDFQARLNTVSGVITFVYQLNSGPGTGTSYQPQVGIRTSTTDFKNRLVASGSETWATSLAGTLNNNTCRFTAASPAKSFTSGQTYTFTPPACFAPSSLSAGSVTNSSASISFAGAGSAFILEYGAPGFTPGTDNNPGVGGTIVTGSASPIAISGLTANTTYDVYIRQDCGGGIYSVNSAKVTFTTLCDAVTTYPYTEGFNSVGVIPSCWSVAEGSPGASYHWQAVAADATHGAGSAAEGAAFMIVNYYNASTTYNPYYLKSVPFDLGASAKRAKFAIWMGANSGTNNLKFEISNDGGTTWTTLDTYTANPANSSSSAPWDNGKIVDLSAYTNQTVIFRLNATSNYGSGFCNIGFDNFVVEDLPACAEPTALSAGSVTNNSASISFTGAGTAYILEYGAAGFTPGTDNNPGGGTIVTGSGSPIAITGLTNNTTYDVYIRQDCGGGVYSVNSTKVTFTTICAIPTALSAGSITTTSASISFTGSGSAYILEYGASGFTPGTDNNPGAGTIVTGSGSPIAMSGLTSSTIYDVYIRRDCGGGDYSANSAKLTFTTLCDAVTTYPYTEGFNSSTLPVCWSVSEGSPGASQHWQPVTADATHGAGASAEGSHFLRMNYYSASTTYNPYYLKSLSFDLGATAKRAKFAIWMGSASGTNNLKFEISTDGGGTWTTLETYTANPANSSSSAPWDSKTVDLSSYTNQTVIFRLNATSNFGSGYCNIGFDNFVVEDLPACAEPTGLSAGSVTNNSASISFTGAGTAYILEYGAAGFTPGTDNNPGVGGTIVTGSGSPIAMSGLTSNTVYDVYIRQDCGGGIYSPNSTKVTFTTLCDATNVPYTQDFESATVPALPACTLMENVGAGNNWVTVSAPGNGFTTKALKYGYNDTEAANVWFYTQGINLTSGVAYTISYNYGNNSTTYAPEKLKVAYGTAANNGAMINVLADHPNINQAALQSNTVVFTPSVTGVYYFGFNAYSDANMYNLYVDNITIDVAPWTWTGATDTDWGIASNWDLGSVPTATNSVVIPATANQPIIGATQSVKNIKVNAGATLTVNNTLNVKNVINSGAIIGSGTLLFNANEAQSLATGTGNVAIANLSVEGASTNLTVSGTSNLNIANVLTVQDGNTLITGGLVVLKSDATKTARIAPIGTGVITGNVVVERFIPAKATRKWSLLSSPVTQSLANSWQQQIHLTGAGTGGTICPTLTAHSNGFDATLTNASNIYTYNAAGTPGSRWTAVASTNSDNLMAGKGFRVNVRGDRSLGCDLLNGVNMTPSAVTLKSTGSISNLDKNMGSFSITYPNAGINNYVLVGNPYPSALSFSALQGANGSSISVSYAVYIPASAPGVYSYWSDDDGFFTGGSGYDDAKGNTIASGQAVFVQSLVAGDITLNYTESQKDIEGTAGYFKANTKDRVRISLNKDSQIDEVVIRYANDATISNTSIGKKDIPSMNYGTYITSLKGSTHTAVQTRSLSTLSNDEVWLNVGATQSGNYSLRFSQYEDFAGADIYLVDHLAKVTQDVKANPEYVFSVDVNNAATKGSERFSLVFSQRIQPLLTQSIKMYPNPASHQVSILLPQTADNKAYSISVTDMAGKVVMQYKANAGTSQMNIGRLTAGTYLVEVTDSKGNRSTEKLVKQ